LHTLSLDWFQNNPGIGLQAISACLPLPELESLSLHRATIHEIGALELARTIETHGGCGILRLLDLGDNLIGDEAGETLFPILMKNIPSLRILDISTNGLGNRSADAIGLALPESQLTELNVSGNGVGVFGCLSIMKGLRQNSTLEKLSLSKCYVAGRGGCAEAISIAILNHPHLLELDFSFNFLDDESATVISNDLSGKQLMLRNLNFSNNWISEEGALVLATSIALSLSIDLRCNNLSKTALEAKLGGRRGSIVL